MIPPDEKQETPRAKSGRATGSGTSIIVPAGRPALRPELLTALDHFIASGQAVEVIWVSPEPAEALRGRKDFRNITTEKLLAPGAMRNRGAHAARGDVFLFIDDDCVPPPDWARDMRDALQALHGTGAVGCAYATAHPGFWAKCADHALFSDCVSTQSRYRPVGSGAMAVLAHVFLDVGGFDENMLASEDFEFGLRLAEAGWKVRYEPAIRVAHHHNRMTFRAILRSAFVSGRRSGLDAQRRHPGTLSWLARLSLRMSSPCLYPFLILPYAVLVAGNHIREEMRRDPTVLLYAPACLAGRIAYQFGVWIRLLADRGADRKTGGRTSG